MIYVCGLLAQHLRFGIEAWSGATTVSSEVRPCSLKLLALKWRYTNRINTRDEELHMETCRFEASLRHEIHCLTERGVNVELRSVEVGL